MMRKRLASRFRFSGVFAIIVPVCVLSARAEIVESVSMPANSHEQVSGGRFEEIPAPTGARTGSQWFACEPSESWGTWIGDGKAEFFLDTLEEDGQRIKACRT